MFAQICCTEYMRTVSSEKQDDRLIAPPPAPLALFSSFPPLPVKLKCNVIQQN